jgi:hypothetical protein
VAWRLRSVRMPRIGAAPMVTPAMPHDDEVSSEDEGRVRAA